METNNPINISISTDTLTEVFNNINDNLSILDEAGNVIWANNSYLRRLGKNFKDVIYKKCYSLWHNLNSPCTDCPCFKALKTNKIEIYERSTPEQRHFILIAIPFKTKENKKLVFEIGREITEKKLTEKYVEFIQMKAFTNILDDLCHQLKNIFTGIFGFAQLLKEDIQNEKANKKINGLMNALKKGNDFLKALEKFRRLDTENKIFDLNYLLISMEDTLKEIIDNENIKLKISPHEKPCLINSDPFQIREVLIELTKNAKFAIEDKGTIEIKLEKVNSKVILTIEDTGKGMTEEEIKRCFEPLFTTDPRKFGLGLTIVKNIVEKMNGWIEINSYSHVGTRIKIYFPEATLPQEQDI